MSSSGESEDAALATLTPVEELARALTRFFATAAHADPWAKYPAVLNVEHVGELLGIDPDSVGEAVRRGRIPMRKRGGKWRIAQDVFRAWLASEDES